jgi:hypothetical protein
MLENEYGPFHLHPGQLGSLGVRKGHKLQGSKREERTTSAHQINLEVFQMMEQHGLQVFEKDYISCVNGQVLYRHPR